MRNLILTTDTIDQVTRDCEERLQNPGILMVYVYGPEDSYARKNDFGGLFGKRIFEESVRQQLENVLAEYSEEKGFVVVADLEARPYSCSWPDPKSHPQIAELEQRILAARASSVQKVEVNDCLTATVEMTREAGINCAVIDNRVPAWDPREQSGDFDPDEI